MGVMTVFEALTLAEEKNLDLVEFAPTAVPPVCKMIDYGKFLYQLQKSTQRQKTPELKEIQLRPSVDEGDYKIKVRKIIEFLTDGHKVKVALRFKGREITHREIGDALLTRLQDDTKAHGNVESYPKLEGKQMIMVLSPQKKH